MDPDELPGWEECRFCGAVVTDAAKHRDWHASKGDFEPEQGTGSGRPSS